MNAPFSFARESGIAARMGLSLTVRTERWPIAGAFTISRGAKTQAEVVVAEVSDGTHIGRGECVPYARYGETAAGVTAALEAMRSPLADGLTRQALQEAMPAGAARNALDCALWDFEAKASGKAVHVLAGMAEPRPLVTAYTISLGTPEAMAQAAAKAAERKLLKVKLGGEGDPARIRAVRAAAPNAALIVDANEAWLFRDDGSQISTHQLRCPPRCDRVPFAHFIEPRVDLQTMTPAGNI